MPLFGVKLQYLEVTTVPGTWLYHPTHPTTTHIYPDLRVNVCVIFLNSVSAWTRPETHSGDSNRNMLAWTCQGYYRFVQSYCNWPGGEREDGGASPLQPRLSEEERDTVQWSLVPVDGSRSSEMAAAQAQASARSHNHNLTGSQSYKIQHNKKLNPAPRGDEQHNTEHIQQVLLLIQDIYT